MTTSPNAASPYEDIEAQLVARIREAQMALQHAGDENRELARSVLLEALRALSNQIFLGEGVAGKTARPPQGSYCFKAYA